MTACRYISVLYLSLIRERKALESQKIDRKVGHVSCNWQTNSEVKGQRWRPCNA